MTLITRSADHRYTFEGVTYPGVTGVLKIIDKSGPLMAWASRMTAEAALDALPTLTPLLETVGRQGVIKALTARSGWSKNEAAAIGTVIHGYADLVARGIPLGDYVSDTVAARVALYGEWWKASGWKVRASEGMVVNPKIGYGGTLDLLAYDRDGKTVLADVKTGRAIYHEAVLQLAAYGMATWIEYGGGLYEMPKPDRYVILHVTDEGVREVEVPVGQIERGAFLAAMSLAAWRDTLKGRNL